MRVVKLAGWRVASDDAAFAHDSSIGEVGGGSHRNIDFCLHSWSWIGSPIRGIKSGVKYRSDMSLIGWCISTSSSDTPVLRE